MRRCSPSAARSSSARSVGVSSMPNDESSDALLVAGSWLDAHLRYCTKSRAVEPLLTANSAPSISAALLPLVRYLDTLAGRVSLRVLGNRLCEYGVTLDDVRDYVRFGEHAWQRNL